MTFYPPLPGLETLPPELLPPDEEPLPLLLELLFEDEGVYVLVLLFEDDEELVLLLLLEELLLPLGASTSLNKLPSLLPPLLLLLYCFDDGAAQLVVFPVLALEVVTALL
jgi:hypothetical protein